jgi:hypothetical protein
MTQLHVFGQSLFAVSCGSLLSPPLSLGALTLFNQLKCIILNRSYDEEDVNRLFKCLTFLCVEMKRKNRKKGEVSRK